MKFTAPNPLNGNTFKNELAQAGIIVDTILIDGEGNLILDVKTTDKTKVEELLKNHDGSDTVPVEVLLKQSAISKLIDLGLTEDEAKAFLG